MQEKLVDKLIEECTETIEEVKLDKIALGTDENKPKCSSCMLHIVLFSIIFTFNVGTATYFFLFSLVFKKKMLLVLSLVSVLTTV